MHALPLIVSALVAAGTAGPLLRMLPERENYRSTRVAFPGGVVVVVAAAFALLPLGVVQQLSEGDVWRHAPTAALLFVFGAAVLGLLDDLLGGEPRGWRGHGRAAMRGELSTGAVKAIGTAGLAAFVLSAESDTGKYLLAVALVLLTTNLFNLFDLRPGRSIKVLVLLGAGLTIGSGGLDPLWTLGLFVGPLLVMLPLDLRERTMLGDTGSNAVGAVAGLWMALTLSTLGQVIALAVVTLITLYGEFRSISEWIERTPLVRSLDSLGRLKGTAHA